MPTTSVLRTLGGALTGAEVMSSTAALSGTLIYHMADHAGLNVPPESTLPLDWPEVFAAKQAVYVGSTGYRLGQCAGVGLAEQMMTLLTQYLVEGSDPTGRQRSDASQESLLRTSTTFDVYDEKTLLEFTLYGLPMYAIQTPAAGSAQPSLSAGTTRTTPCKPTLTTALTGRTAPFWM